MKKLLKAEQAREISKNARINEILAYIETISWQGKTEYSTCLTVGENKVLKNLGYKTETMDGGDNNMYKVSWK